MSRFTRISGAVAPAILFLGLAGSASAAPILGPAGEAFYAPPSSVPIAGTPGELVSYRPSTVNLGTGAPATKAWTVLYRSTDAKGQPEIVSGTVIRPTATLATRPIVSYAFGTHGQGKQCAPSKQLASGVDYEKGNIAATIKKGYTVAATDYAGYTAGTSPNYTVAADEAHNVLDIVKAASQIPSGGISATAKTAIWGYSIGGQAAAAAAELKTTYAPTINLVGLAAGGIPGDLRATAGNLNSAWGAGFLLGAVLGLQNQYPESIPFDDLANSAGQAAKASASSNCVFQQLNKWANKDIADFSTDHLSLAQLLAIPSVGARVDEQKLGTKTLPVPMYDYHGAADQFIPLDQAYDLKRAYCAKGVRVTFDLYAGEHIGTQTQAPANVLNYLADRFAGKAAPTSCAKNVAPVSTAAPRGGDQIVNLNAWNLTGTVRLNTLAQTLALPTTSRLTAVTNLTQQTLVADIAVPYFKTQIKVLGIPVKVGLNLVPTGQATGTVSLDDEGQLHLSGNAPVAVRLENLGVGPIQLGTNCRTERGVQIPITFDGSVAALGDGTLGTKSTATFPNLVDCYIYGPILSALMSGPGQQFNLNFVPPAPKTGI
jgi:predicted dienelactone hydrolase